MCVLLVLLALLPFTLQLLGRGVSPSPSVVRAKGRRDEEFIYPVASSRSAAEVKRRAGLVDILARIIADDPAAPDGPDWTMLVGCGPLSLSPETVCKPLPPLAAAAMRVRPCRRPRRARGLSLCLSLSLSLSLSMLSLSLVI